jgi:hypothetical protein
MRKPPPFGLGLTERPGALEEDNRGTLNPPDAERDATWVFAVAGACLGGTIAFFLKDASVLLGAVIGGWVGGLLANSEGVVAAFRNRHADAEEHRVLGLTMIIGGSVGFLIAIFTESVWGMVSCGVIVAYVGWLMMNEQALAFVRQFARWRRRAMLVGGVLLFVFNIVPDSPINHFTPGQKAIYRHNLASGQLRNNHGGGYYWSSTNALLAAVGAAFAVLAVIESRGDRF